MRSTCFQFDESFHSYVSNFYDFKRFLYRASNIIRVKQPLKCLYKMKFPSSLLPMQLARMRRIKSRILLLPSVRSCQSHSKHPRYSSDFREILLATLETGANAPPVIQRLYPLLQFSRTCERFGRGQKRQGDP